MTRRVLPIFLVAAFLFGLSSRTSAQIASPDAPSSVTITISNATILVQWSPPAGGSAVLGYRVEFGNSPGTTFAVVNVGTATSFTATLPTGSYVVRVRTIIASGPEEASPDIPFSIGPAPVPLAPRDLRAQFNGNILTITWNLPTESSAPSSYLLEVGTGPGLLDVGVFDTGSASRILTFVPPVTGTFWIRVRARNAFGISGASEDLMVVIKDTGEPCTGTPAPPAALMATVVPPLVTLNWSHPLVGGPITGYSIEVGTGPGASNLGTISVGPVSIFAANAPSGTYYVRVRAHSACGTSAPSNEVVVAVP